MDIAPTPVPPVVDALPQKPVEQLATQSSNPERLKQVSQDFEALLIQSMFKAMRRTIPEGGLFTRDTSHRIYEDMLDAEISKAMAKKRQLGIADTIYEQVQRKSGKGEMGKAGPKVGGGRR